jgi:hypothetical protein
MASTKLTLLVDRSLAARAKRYGKRHRTSVSRLVSHMLASLPDDEEAALTPGVRRLVGLLPASVSAEEQRRHLSRKHGL